MEKPLQPASNNSTDELIALDTSFDIRAEALAARIVATSATGKEPLDVDQIIIAPQGPMRRRSSHEIKNVRKRHYDEELVIQLEVHRKGFFDTLPQALFLSDLDNLSSPKERTIAIENQIKEARRFFLPFEQSIYHPSIYLEQLEQDWTEHFPDFIPSIWGLDDFDDCLLPSQKFLLCYLIPEAYRIAGDWELTALCFEEIMKKPILLHFTPPIQHKIPDYGCGDGSCHLGVDMLLGEHFMDDSPALEVVVKGVSTPDLPDFLEGGKWLRVLEELLYSYFLPLETAVRTHIKVTGDAWSGVIDDVFLGYNFILTSATEPA